jgi:flagellar hook-length control protein FliK
MSISAISNLVAASGGKAVQSGLGESQSSTGLPQDFAAFLAGQIAPAGETLLASQESQKSGSGIPVEIPTQRGQIEESAASILAALSTNQGLPARTMPGETNGVGREKKQETDSSDIQLNTDAAAQYIIPQITPPPVQHHLQGSTDHDEASDTNISDDASRSLLPEQPDKNALAQTTFAAKASESLSIPQPDTPHAAILAGDTTPNSGSNTPDSGSNTPTPTSALTATGTASAKATSADQPPSITSTLNSPNWSKDFGSRVVWLAKNDQQVAHININPPQLGPVQISISLNGDQANTVFASPHAEVRQAIQDSLPQLREMFSAAGISLGQANVGSQLPSQNREAAFQFANEARGAGENAILSPDSHASSSPAGIPIQRGRGLVDLFA